MIFPWRKKPTTESTHEPSKPVAPVEQLTREALLKINASLTSQPENDNTPEDNETDDTDTSKFHNFEFEYQGGFFIAIYTDDSRFIRLMMPVILRTGIENTSEVGFLCSRLGTGSVCHAWYSSNSDESQVEVSIGMPVYAVNDVELLATSLKEGIAALFDYRNEWQTAFNGIMNHKTTEIHPFEFEMNMQQRLRKLHIVRMAEAFHTAETYSRPHVTATPSMIPTLADTLKAAFDIDPADIKAVNITTAGAATRTLSAAEIKSYGLLDDMWPEQLRTLPLTRFAAPWTLLRVDYVDRRRMIPRARLNIMLTDYGKDATNGFVSATITLEGGDPMDGVETGSRGWQPEAIRMVIATSRSTTAEAVSEFKYMLADARDKMSEGRTDALSPEQALLLRAFISDSGYHLYHGTIHFYAGRYLQAAPLLATAYDDMLARHDKMDEAAEEAFLEVCFMLGMCCCEFHNYERAHFYLSMTVNRGNYMHDREYINCMVGAHDFRAIDLINSALSDFDEYRKQNHDQVTLQAEEMYHFLRRRKAYIFVESGRLDEAESILKTMVDEAANHEFAIDELAYIRRLRGQK